MTSDQTQKKIDVVVDAEELKRFEEKAFESLRRDLVLPGFRKGTVTADVARQHITPESIFAEAVERAVSEKGTEAIKDVLNRVVGQPDVQVTKAALGNPLEFSVTVELLPEVDVSNWRQLRLPFSPKNVTEVDIDKALEEVRRSRVRTQAVNRVAQKGDLVEIDFETRINGVKAEGGESKNHPMVLGEGKFVPGFEDVIVGMQRGEKKQSTLPFPKDWPQKRFAGEEGEFRITLNNVLERIFPDVNDEFAKSLGSFDDLAALRKSIREGIALEKEAEEKQRVRQEAVKQLGKHIKEKAIPKIVLEQELLRMREEFKNRIESYGATLEQYLTEIGKKEDEMEQDWRDAAIERVRATLVVRAISHVEAISPDPEALEARADEFLKRQRDAQAADEPLDPDRVRSYTETVLINELTLDLIEAVVTGKAGNDETNRDS